MAFALEELSGIYPEEEIRAITLWLFEEFLEVERVDYQLNIDKGMSESELLKFNFAIKDLKKGKPIQHILGYTWFLDLKLQVNEHTLIPRPETEELVQYIISQEESNSALKILDIGTGSACIPLALEKAMPQNEYYGIDFKSEIIELAYKNSQAQNSNINLIQLDILKEELSGDYDVIISNPPYVLESEKKEMHKNVVDFEPESALYVKDSDPLLFYEKIILQAKKHLNINGRLYLEINERYGNELSELLNKHGFESIKILNDFRGRIRFCTAFLRQKKSSV
ncbi:peptide chain release factor N(5)-glutamine methyltransferase [Lentimicrobium sp. S6]|uniref:peptide chain release factor N(5)-glutamine methyltransferase n=1 Tax=Lentimicrobium sp. S6 TaxID=2735872 RepID=UPI0015580EE2|nr:peptide chain release factor N(5)-glutamine methyltransferase [Lentimicrobium sp. S6]NPD47726.1 peptide chain release factor N(5)-glutamine methyltransferase [Lentimicrobium sp. S6]